MASAGCAHELDKSDCPTLFDALLLLLATAGLAVAAQRRYLALRRKHKVLQRLYDKSEQQLETLWARKSS